MRDEYVKVKIGFGEKSVYIIAKRGERIKLPNGSYVTAGSNIEDKEVTKSELKQYKKSKKLELKKKKSSL